jgi:hypothetical protein
MKTRPPSGSSFPGALPTSRPAGRTGRWYVGCNANSAGNYSVYQYDFTTTRFANGAGVRIAVTATTGSPWLVSAAGYVYKHASPTATSGTWEVWSARGKAYDIALAGGAGDTPWIISRTKVTNGYQVEYWSENSHTWVPSTGGGIAISGSVAAAAGDQRGPAHLQGPRLQLGRAKTPSRSQRA